MRKFVLETKNFVLQTRNCVLKMMHFAVDGRDEFSIVFDFWGRVENATRAELHRL